VKWGWHVGSHATTTGKVRKMKRLGNASKQAGSQTKGGITFTMPAPKPCDYTCMLKMTGTGPAADGNAMIIPPPKALETCPWPSVAVET